jgi:DNA polymerase III delta prime subunit
MDAIDFNHILERDSTAKTIKELLTAFEKSKTDLNMKRGLYIYGAPGSGKTEFVLGILKELNYDVIKYDAGDIRNKSIIDTITKNNISDKNIVSLFFKKPKPIAIVMDEIDGMNNGDKGGINSLIKLIRPKKTKKQKIEDSTFSPIICISNYHIDKKIKELMKVCNTFEIKSPTEKQMQLIVKTTMPELEKSLSLNLIHYLQGDLRKLNAIYNIYRKKNNILQTEIIKNIFKPKSYNDDTKEITKKMFNAPFTINDHQTLLNETDRTTLGLLWHENIIDVLEKLPKEKSIAFYSKVLDNICFADYIDRITFQKQIWQFNEMSSLIKTFHCNKMYHDEFAAIKKPKFNPIEVRFTKVLTKYSTEYNNSLFIQNLCQQLGLDKKDMFSFFLEIRNNNTNEEEIYEMFEPYEIRKLDIERIYRYLDKYTTSNCNTESNDDDDGFTQTLDTI